MIRPFTFMTILACSTLLTDASYAQSMRSNATRFAPSSESDSPALRRRPVNSMTRPTRPQLRSLPVQTMPRSTAPQSVTTATPQTIKLDDISTSSRKKIMQDRTPPASFSRPTPQPLAQAQKPITRTTPPVKATKVSQPSAPSDNIATQRGWEEYVPQHARHTAKQPALRGNITTGYRMDEFDWNVAGNIAGENPTIASELTWEDLQMYQFAAQAEYTHRDGPLSGIHADVSGSYAEIFSGDNSDTDFTSDNREDISFQANNSGDDGDAISFKAGIGYEIALVDTPDNYAWITPLVGYSYNELNLSITDGFQTVPEASAGPIAGVNSSYDTQWDGPFIALKGGSQYGAHRLSLRGEYTRADYEGVGNWNLRTDLNRPVSFLHTGDADGLALQASYAYSFTDNFALYASAAYQTWSVEDGSAATILANSTAQATRFNEANWDSQAYNVGVSYSF